MRQNKKYRSKGSRFAEAGLVGMIFAAMGALLLRLISVPEVYRQMDVKISNLQRDQHATIMAETPEIRAQNEQHRTAVQPWVMLVSKQLYTSSNPHIFEPRYGHGMRHLDRVIDGIYDCKSYFGCRYENQKITNKAYDEMSKYALNVAYNPLNPTTAYVLADVLSRESEQHILQLMRPDSDIIATDEVSQRIFENAAAMNYTFVAQRIATIQKGYQDYIDAAYVVVPSVCGAAGAIGNAWFQTLRMSPSERLELR